MAPPSPTLDHVDSAADPADLEAVDPVAMAQPKMKSRAKMTLVSAAAVHFVDEDQIASDNLDLCSSAVPVRARAEEKGKLAELKGAESGTVAGSRSAGDMEADLWLCPLEDRRRQGSRREGMLEGFSFGSYLLLVDYTSRLCRQGKARASREVDSILERLGTSADAWGHRIQRLFEKTRLLGSYFCTDRERLREFARKRGVHHLNNLAASPA